MKIGYVCCDPGVPIFGSKGASVHVRELCRALERLGHEVLVVSPRAGGRRPDGFAAEVIEIPVAASDAAACEALAGDPVAGPAAAREIRALVYAASLRSELTSVLRSFGAEVAYERHALFASAGAAAARALGIPHVVEVNAPLSDEQAAYRGLVFGGAARTLERNVLRSADRVVAVSSGVEAWLLELGVEPGRVALVPNAVDPDRFALGPEARTQMRRRLGVGDEPVVGFVGTLKPWHDAATLVRAVGELRRAGSGVRLLVVGDGPERSRLEALARAEAIAEATCFVGPVPNDDVPRYLAALDVAAVTYESRPDFYFSPLKLFECLAAGLPVVAADAGDIGHCVRPGETGLLYRPGDSRSLADALLAVLGDRERAAAIAAAGREHVRAHHTWIRNAEAVTELVRAAATPAERALAWA